MKPVDFYRKALHHLMGHKNLSQKELSERVGIAQTELNDFIHGRKNFSVERLERIAESLETSYIDMLVQGRSIAEGKVEPPPPQPEQPLIVDVVNGFEKLDLEAHLEHYRGVPLYESGKLAARVGGYCFDENEKPDSTVVVYQPELQGRIKHDLRALRVGGDSMWPRIPEGSIVVVDLNDREFVDDKIYVVREPFSDPPIATVKRIRKVSQKHFKGFALVSENRKYLPEMTDFDWNELVVGRAVWMWRSLEEA